MNELIPYIKTGITIELKDHEYQVFTIPTQHFIVNSLEELTPERFELEIERQKHYQSWMSEMFLEYCDIDCIS